MRAFEPAAGWPVTPAWTAAECSYPDPGALTVTVGDTGWLANGRITITCGCVRCGIGVAPGTYQPVLASGAGGGIRAAAVDCGRWRGCRVALGLGRDVSPLRQEPEHEQRLADEGEGGDVGWVIRRQQSAEAVEEVSAAGDDEQDSEKPGERSLT